MGQRWYENNKIERWLSFIVLVGLIGVIGPAIINSVVADGSTWNWVKLFIWVLAVISFAHTTVRAWRPRHTGQVVPPPPPEVAAADAQRIVAGEPSRVGAVKALRQQHPDLNLKDAAALVDTARTTP